MASLTWFDSKWGKTNPAWKCSSHVTNLRVKGLEDVPFGAEQLYCLRLQIEKYKPSIPWRKGKMQGCKQVPGLSLFRIRALCVNWQKLNNSVVHVSEQSDTEPELISKRSWLWKMTKWHTEVLSVNTLLVSSEMFCTSGSSRNILRAEDVHNVGTAVS